MRRAHKGIAVAGLLALGACGATEPSPNPSTDIDFKSQINLAAMLSPTRTWWASPCRRKAKANVLDRVSGLYLLEDATRARLVFAAPSGIDLTDVVALGGERFAVRPRTIGFLLDVHNQSFSSYFCYLPGTSPRTRPWSRPASARCCAARGSR